MLTFASLLPAAVLAFRHWWLLPPVQSGDYAQYLLHAKAIVQGRPYADTGYIYSSLAWTIGPQAYPPGLPLTLAPIVAVAGLHSQLFKWLMIVSGALFLLISSLYIGQRTSKWIGATVLLLSGVAIENKYATTVVISDLGFCALLWLAIYIADRPGRWSWRRATAVTVLGLAAVLYRVAGVAVVPAFGVFALLQWRTRGSRVWLPPIVWFGSCLFVLLYERNAAPFVAQLASQFYDLVLHIHRQLWSYRHAATDSLTDPFVSNLASHAYHVLAIPLATIGAIRFLWPRRTDALALFCMFYFAMLLVAPVNASRYMWPLFPLAAVGLAGSLDALLKRASWTEGYRVDMLVWVVCAVIAASATRTALQQQAPQSLLDNAAVQQVFTVLRTAGPGSDAPRVMFFNPRVLTLETGVPAMGIPFVSEDGRHSVTWPELESEISCKRLTHIVVGDLHTRSRFIMDGLERFIKGHPDGFTRILANSSFVVYRINRSASMVNARSSTRSDTCTRARP